MEKKISIKNGEALKKYVIHEEFTMGVCLRPKDIKGFKSGKVDISRALGTIKNNELYIKGMRIRGAALKNPEGKLYEPDRKLLERRDTLDDLIKRVFSQRLSIVPLEVLSNDEGLMKIKIGVGVKNPDWVPPVRHNKQKNGFRAGGNRPYKHNKKYNNRERSYKKYQESKG